MIKAIAPLLAKDPTQAHTHSPSITGMLRVLRIALALWAIQLIKDEVLICYRYFAASPLYSA